MNLTADQQFQLLTRMATQAAAAGVPQDQIEAKLNSFKTRIEEGENVFAPVFERARELTVARKNFNKPEAPWTPDLARETAAVPNSPSKGVPAAVAADREAARYGEENMGGLLGAQDASKNAMSTAARTLLGAAAGASQMMDPVGSGIGSGLGVAGPEEAAFQAIDSLRKQEEARRAGGIGGVAGSLLGGFATLGLGSLSSGQDVLAKGGTLPNALAATAVDAATLEAGLLTGKLLPNSSVAARMAAQGAGSGAAGIGGRAAKNEFVPDSMKQDALDPLAIALDVGGGAAGGIFPDRPRTSAPSTIKTGDPAIDAGIGAVEKMMGKGVDTSKKTFDIDVNEPFKQFFEVPRKDFSTNPRETVDAEAFLNEPRKQDEIKKAYDQLKAERRATEELAYAQKAASDAAIYQELPGIMPTEPVRGAAEQAVPRGTNLNLDQLSVLRDQLRQTAPEAQPAVAPSGPQKFDTSFVPDERNPVQAESTQTIEQPLPDVSYLNRKARKITPSNDWTYNPARSLAEQVPPETVAQIKQTQALDLEAKMAEIENTKPFDGTVAKPIRLAGNLADQTSAALTRSPTPRVVEDLYNSGELRSGDVIGSIMDDSEGLYKGAEQFRSMMGHLNSLGEKLGGLDTPVIRFDPNNALHAESFERVPKPTNPEEKVGGWYDPVSNAIYMDMNRPNMKLAVHEVTHAITNRVLDMGEAGKLIGPAKQAYSDFSTLFDTLKPQLAEMAGADLNKKYGLRDLHEYMSEFYSNPTFRENLKQLKITPEYTQKLGLGRLAVAKMKNLYEATTQFIRKSFGLPDRAESALDLLFSASHRFTESIDETTANQSRVENSTETRAGLLPNKAQEAGVPGIVKSALIGDGRFPLIRQAKEIASGEKALGVTEAETLANRYNKATKSFTPAQIKTLDADMKIAVENSSKPEGREALARLEQVSPVVGNIVREFANGRRSEAIAMARSFAQNPNVTDMQKAIAYKVLEQADTYLTRAYAINENPRLGKLKLKLADRADKKIAAGKTPFARETEALRQRDALKVHLEDKYFGNNLAKMRSTELEDIYTYFTGKQIEDIVPLSAFTGPNPKALRKAYLIGEIQAAQNKTHSVPEAVNQLVDVIARVNNTAPVARYFKNLREGSDVASTLKHVPKEIAEFWGEVEKPIARMMATVRNQASINSQLNALTSLRKEGLGTLFQEGKGHEGFTETLAGEKMGPLQGLNTTPEAKAALESFVQTGPFLGSWDQVLSGDPTGRGALAKLAVNVFEGAKKFTSLRKNMSVLGNFVGSIMRNGYGSGLQALANGNMNLAHWKDGAGDMMDLINLSGRQNISPGAARAIKYKIAEATQLEDTYSAGARRVFQKMMDDGGFTTPDTYLQKAGEIIKGIGYKGQDAVRIAKEVYGAADLWSKLANYRYELEFWNAYNQKHGGIGDVEKFVADRINNTNITPGRASPAAKVSDYTGASTFLPYTMEVGRSLYNNMEYGFQDMIAGSRAGRPELVIHGAKRAIGATAAVGAGTWALSAGLKGMGALTGVVMEEMAPDSDRKKYLESRDFTAGSEPLSIKDSAGNEFIIDAGMMNPYDPVAKPVNKILEALGEKDPKRREAKLKEAQKAVAGLFHQNSVWAYLSKAYEGKEPNIAKSNPKLYKATLEWAINDLGMSKKQADSSMNTLLIVSPKGVLEASRGYNEDTDPKLKALIGTGVGVNKLDASQDLANYEGSAFTAQLNKAKKNYTDLLKVDFEVDPKRVEADFVSALKDLAEPYNKLQLAVNAAKEQGKTDRQIRDALKLGKVNNKAVDPLLKGKSPPLSLIISSLESDIADDIRRDNSPATIERGRRNRAILRDLRLKYNNVTAEELARGE